MISCCMIYVLPLLSCICILRCYIVLLLFLCLLCILGFVLSDLTLFGSEATNPMQIAQQHGQKHNVDNITTAPNNSIATQANKNAINATVRKPIVQHVSLYPFNAIIWCVYSKQIR
eukprot:126662_1